jgi:hypothetical protein
MTTAPLLFGFVFWTSATFFACRRAFTGTEGRLTGLLGAVKKKAPILLWLGTGGGFVSALVFFFLQQRAIEQHAGLVGPHYLLAILCGVVGAISLAAQVYLED